MKLFFNHKKLFFSYLFIFLIVFFVFPQKAMATQEELNAEAEARKSETVETNEIDGWPIGPVNGAKSAVLMNADTSAILYSKNPDEKLYPASTTKIMTCLVAIENCNLDELITVNQSAIDANDPDGSNMGLSAGEKLTLEELLYGILINSANEACNAVAEHIAGSQEAYVEMMNQKAIELGCTNTHFVTTNGLHDESHYVSARDLALIASEFFKYDLLCKISSTGQYTIPANSYHKEFNLVSHNKLTAGRDYAYDSLVGSKTGFTSLSRQTLVSCANQNGMKLICVILREESPYQFEDTVALFDYGFSNFTKLNIASNENNYTITDSVFFQSGNDLFGCNTNLITIDESSDIFIPNTLTINDLDRNIIYGKSSNPNAFATIEYSYNDIYLGSADILVNPDAFDNNIDNNNENLYSNENQKIINIGELMIILFFILFAIVIFILFGGIIINFFKEKKHLAKIRKMRKETETRRRPVHHKNSKINQNKNKNKNQDNNNGFVKRKKHRVYKKPIVHTLYDTDANKPGNKKSGRKF